MKSQVLLFQFFFSTSILSLLRYVSAQGGHTSNHDDDVSDDDNGVNGGSPATATIANTIGPLPSFDSSVTITPNMRPVVTTAPGALTDGNLTYVNNSGICETKPGAHQVSGYINISKNTHLVGSCSSS